jgi:hypothetical protein
MATLALWETYRIDFVDKPKLVDAEIWLLLQEFDITEW